MVVDTSRLDNKRRTTTSSEGFKPTNGRKFFQCPCFDKYPERANARENQLATGVYVELAQYLEGIDICPNRGMLITLKVVALMAQNIPQAERHEVEQQLHDVLDLELSNKPSNH